jgi:hypothetical protein
VNWAEYVELFGTKQERVELMNKAAPFFFSRIQDGLWDATLLHIARLTDPPKTSGKANLTINNLQNLISDATLKAKVVDLLKEVEKHVGFCRDWRNRLIAHNDLALALKEPAKPVAEGSRKQVKDALEALAKVMNAVELHYTNGTTATNTRPGTMAP